MARTKSDKVDKEKQQFLDDLDIFIKKSGVKATPLKEGAQITYWLDTGSCALNWVICNDFFKGVPGARSILITGDPGKGKSFLLDIILGSCIRLDGKSYKVNIENAALFDFTKQILGEDIAEKIILIEPEDNKVISIEKLTEVINKVIDFQASKKEGERRKITVGIDSVTQLTSNKEMEIVAGRKEGKKEKKDLTSPVKMREMFRTIEQRLPCANLTLVGIGQLTANIPASGFVAPGTPTKVANTKGTGFAYASSLTINMISDKEITSKAGIPIGIKMKMKTMKNRIRYKGRECWVYFYFNRGIDKLGGLCELLSKYGVFEAKKVNVDKNTGEIKLDKNGNAKMSKVEPLANGEYPPGTSFLYTSVSGKELRFKVTEFAKVVEEMGGDEFLKELNEKLNTVYNDMLKEMGINEEEAIYEEDNDFDNTGEEKVDVEENE